MVEPTLACTALAGAYGRRQVLFNLTLQFPRGSITAIIGPNGSGKSTLLRVLGGALAPLSGDIAVLGHSYRELSRIERARQVAFVPQVFPLALPLTVAEALSIACYPRANADRGKAVEAALQRIGIAHLRDRQCESLSGGELRKMLLAQGLVQLDGRGALLLDEPAAFLDPRAQAALTRLIRDLTGEGYAIAMVLHDLQLAQGADQVVLLREGRLLGAGAPGDIMTAANIEALYADGPAEQRQVAA